MPRSLPEARRFKTFEREVAALLTEQRYSRAEALSAVRRHGPLVRAAWQAGKAPCGTADQIRGHERGKMRRDPDSKKTYNALKKACSRFQKELASKKRRP